ncbi:MAG: type II secretion system F family protein [Rhodospirillaceae bacterium]
MTLDTLPIDPALLIGLLAGGAFLLLTLAISGARKERHIDQRLKSARARALGTSLEDTVLGGVKGGKGKAKPQEIRRQDREKTSAVERVIAQRIPKRSVLKRRLARTGYAISLASYVMASLLVGLINLAALYALTDLPLIASVLISAATALKLPLSVVDMLGNRRTAKFNAGFPDAIDLMVRGLKSGLPVNESISAVGREMTGPVGEEFRSVSDSMRLGRQMEDALWEASDRLQLQEFKFFVISLAIQRETGGNLGETLGNLSEVLRARKQMGLKIKALSSEARASAYILGSLPLLMGVILYILNADYISTLFTDPRGHVAIGFGVATVGVGALIMWRMIRFEV